MVSRAEKSSIVAIVTARGGSKGLPRKNILPLNGKPLIAFTIEAAKKCKFIDVCYVTTEDEEIAQISYQYGAVVIDRPLELSTDISLSTDVVMHFIDKMMEKGPLPKYFILLQPTSPLRTEKHISECLNAYLESNCNSAISVCLEEHHPYKNFTIDSDGSLSPFWDQEYLSLPRQALPIVYRQNGAIYVADTEIFLECKSFYLPPVMPYIMSPRDSIDIDSELDLQFADMLLSSHHD